jgi:hypothetical protein
MGLAVQLKHLGLEMDPRWIPRGQNSEADSLTSSEFMSFDPAKRTTIDSEKTKFKVMIMELDDEIKLAKSSKKTKADMPVGSMTKRKRGQTRWDWTGKPILSILSVVALMIYERCHCGLRLRCFCQTALFGGGVRPEKSHLSQHHTCQPGDGDEPQQDVSE